MNSNQEKSNILLYEDEVDLSELFSVLWKDKLLILVFTITAAIFSIIYALYLPNYYSSESVLIARDSQDSGLISQYSGLTSMMGINLSDSGNSSVYEVMEIIQSREFVKHLITFENILPSIMAAKGFDKNSKKINYDPEIYDSTSKQWLSESGSKKPLKPSYLEAHEVYISEMLTISRNEKTGLIYISIEHISPIFAKDFLTLIIREANKLNREIDIISSSKALSYLEKELSQTSLVEIKKSINQLIESQLETRMMASVHEEYSLILLEPPFIPEKKSKPSRALIVILATLLSGIAISLYVLFRHFKKQA